MGRRRIAALLHALGEAPLFHFLNEIEAGAPVWAHAERYAELPATFIRANGGDRFPEPFPVPGGGDDR